MRIAFLVLLLVFSGIDDAFAVADDSLFVRTVRGGWELWHRCKSGETLGDLSRKYGVERDFIAAVNRLAEADSTPVYGPIQIPIVPRQIVSDTGVLAEPGVKPLYYRLMIGDRMSDLCRLSGVTPAELIRWNGGAPELSPGRVMLLGWLRVPVPVKSKEEEFVESLQHLWEDQTVGGKNVLTEKGSAGFYNLSARTSEAAWYAFHNVVAKGTVMKVRNINNGRVIYVKVIGPLPAGNQFHGCQLGLSDVAKQALDAKENKVFCEMRFGGY